MGKTHTVLFTAAVLSLATQAVDAQSEYIEYNNRSAIGIFGGFSSNKEATSLDLGFGFSILGRADITLGYSGVSLKEKLFGEEVSASVIQFGGSLFPVKQSSTIPVSLALHGGIAFAAYESDALDYLGWEMTGTAAGFGVSLYHRLNLTPSFSLQPSLSLSYARSTVTVEDSYGNSVEEKDTATSVGFGLSFLIKTASRSTLVLHPALSFDEDLTTFGISLGFVGEF
jgi:hypothetical protein